MDEAYGATVAKRRLARTLTELRVDAGYTANQVCDRLNWGRGKVGRFEANQWKRPEMSDIRDLLRLYGVGDERQKELEDLAMLARARPWWREYGDVFDTDFPGYEADAARISVYMPLILPGLLQTPAYIRAHMELGSRSEEWRPHALESRLRRQRILDREDETVPDLIAVITEASLMYQWGSRADRRDQLFHLVTMSQRPSITIRLLRFADGPHPGMSSLINLFEFHDDPAILYLENDTTVAEIDDPADVAAYHQLFDAIADASLGPADTTTYLRQFTTFLDAQDV